MSSLVLVERAVLEDGFVVGHAPLEPAPFGVTGRTKFSEINGGCNFSAAKTGPKSTYATPTEIPGLNDRPARATMRQNCIHCHMIKEYSLRAKWDAGQLTTADLYVYPQPKNIGLQMDLDDGHVDELQRVTDCVRVVRPRPRVDDDSVGRVERVVAPLDELAFAVRLPAADVTAEPRGPLVDPRLELRERDPAVHGRVAARQHVEVDAVEDHHLHWRGTLLGDQRIEGRADLSQHEPAWRRLRAIPNIGDWTLEMLAVEGQGRDDKLPALDVAYLKFVGLAARLGRRATEHEVREFFEPYGEYAALAGCYALQSSRVLLRYD